MCEKHTDQMFGSRAWRGHTLANVLQNAQSKRDVIRTIKPKPDTLRSVCSYAHQHAPARAIRLLAVQRYMP